MKKEKQVKEYKPWYYRGEPVTPDGIPEGAIGYVYCIILEGHGLRKDYIGKKQLQSNRRTKIGVKEKAATKTRKTYKIVSKDSGWEQYMGSCKELLWDLENIPGITVHREIIHWCYNKKQMSYYEHKEQFINESLERENSYNSNIGSHWYRRDLIKPTKNELDNIIT